ncbi:MAG: hypothetical protein AAGB00_01780 [Planctomycetota bacterium]
MAQTESLEGYDGIPAKERHLFVGVDDATPGQAVLDALAESTPADPSTPAKRAYDSHV